ncbi:hypothetical protein DDE19_20445 [Micromonospora ureilytica]|uniref:DUF4760 domain-containing protein n=1 Tax=Micromonospora ureilytica TaxID=709868 RepID=A0A3N9XQ09_9ACTN|nr:hypothetical protein [Micromonospora ureilytica]RQX15195.1 hypothetical protein DDE19_20445 [Micromonospora ureilytica]
MSAGDWAQSIIGVLSIVLSASVALWVYRREGKGRREEAEEVARRARRREQHGDDYREAVRTLERFQEIFESALARPKSKDELEAAGLKDAIKSIDGIGRRADHLFLPLGDVWVNAQELAPSFDLTKMMAAAVGSDGSVSPTRMAIYVEAAFLTYVKQREAAHEGLKNVKKARDAVKEEWGKD